ncbi:MAG: HAMP domain-containing sensor histidine kinase [Anaerolineales bacterium]|jgi:signal transduction histidine kinase
MADESDRLIRLLNDLLLMAHADAGRSLVKEIVDVHSVMEDAVRQARYFDEDRQVNLDVSEDMTLMGDRDAFKQVVLILLDNALKYSTGSVDMEGKQIGSRIEIHVQDHGEGIPLEHLDHVFDRFYRADDNSFIPGFGLGLSIAKALVEAMGGTISIESELGHGTNVKMRFPILEDVSG